MGGESTGGATAGPGAFPELTELTHLSRLFATELVNNGLPIHIGAALLGHLDLQTTRGYVAVFDEDVIAHYQQFLDRRRAQRPQGEYRRSTAEEWRDFQKHFDKRKAVRSRSNAVPARP